MLSFVSTSSQQLSEFFVRRQRYRDNLLLMLCANTPMRLEEICLLRREDVYDDAKKDARTHLPVRIRGSGQMADVALNDETVNAIRLYVSHIEGGQSNYLFDSHKNKREPISVRQAQRIIQSARNSFVNSAEEDENEVEKAAKHVRYSFDEAMKISDKAFTEIYGYSKDTVAGMLNKLYATHTSKSALAVEDMLLLVCQYRNGDLSQAAIGRLYGVAASTAQSVVAYVTKKLAITKKADNKYENSKFKKALSLPDDEFIRLFGLSKSKTLELVGYLREKYNARNPAKYGKQAKLDVADMLMLACKYKIGNVSYLALGREFEVSEDTAFNAQKWVESELTNYRGSLKVPKKKTERTNAGAYRVLHGVSENTGMPAE